MLAIESSHGLDPSFVSSTRATIGPKATVDQRPFERRVAASIQPVRAIGRGPRHSVRNGATRARGELAGLDQDLWLARFVPKVTVVETIPLLRSLQ